VEEEKCKVAAKHPKNEDVVKGSFLCYIFLVMLLLQSMLPQAKCITHKAHVVG